MDDVVADKISALTKELGEKNQNELFEALISSYELQQDASTMPDAAKDLISELKLNRA